MDYLRVLAAASVILVHTIEAANERLTPHSPAWELLAVISGLLCFVNLTFLMISGALLLNGREESVLTFYRKRFLKVLIPAVAYYLFYQFYAFGLPALFPSNWFALMKSFTANSTGLTPHFWLIHVILMFYLVAPFFSVMVKHMTEEMLGAMALVIFILHAIFTYGPYMQVHFVTASLLASWDSIFLLGYFCMSKTAMKYYRLILAGGWISALFLIFMVLRVEDYGPLVFNNAPPMLFIACSVFLFFRRHGNDIFSRIHPFLSALGKYSFSILMIHWFVMFEIVEKHLGIDRLSMGIGGGILLSSALTLLISMAFAFFYDNTVVLCADELACILQKAVCLIAPSSPRRR